MYKSNLKSGLRSSTDLRSSQISHKKQYKLKNGQRSESSTDGYVPFGFVEEEGGAALSVKETPSRVRMLDEDPIEDGPRCRTSSSGSAWHRNSGEQRKQCDRDNDRPRRDDRRGQSSARQPLPHRSVSWETSDKYEGEHKGLLQDRDGGCDRDFDYHYGSSSRRQPSSQRQGRDDRNHQGDSRGRDDSHDSSSSSSRRERPNTRHRRDDSGGNDRGQRHHRMERPRAAHRSGSSSHERDRRESKGTENQRPSSASRDSDRKEDHQTQTDQKPHSEVSASRCEAATLSQPSPRKLEKQPRHEMTSSAPQSEKLKQLQEWDGEVLSTAEKVKELAPQARCEERMLTPLSSIGSSEDSGVDEISTASEHEAESSSAVARETTPTTAFGQALGGSAPTKVDPSKSLESGRFGLMEGESFFEDYATKPLIELANAQVPPGQLVLCKLSRERGKRGKATFTLTMEGPNGWEGLDGIYPSRVVLVARREKVGKTPRYLIAEKATSFDRYLGKLKCTSVKGSKYVLYDNGRKREERGVKAIREEIGNVHYTHKSWSNPRGLIVKLPVTGTAPMSFVNALPEWDPTLKVHSLKFNGRATEISVKNFKLVRDGVRSQTAGAANQQFYLRFGKIGKDTFNCDFRAPMTPLQAFSIALTSFEGGMC